jgi:hypothetical protein
VPAKVKPEEMKLAKQVISTFESELNLKDYTDEYKEGLRKIIDAKIAGREIVAPEDQEPPKVVDLMEALRRSLDSVSKDKKKAAKVEVAKPVARPKANGAKKQKGRVEGRLYLPSRFRSVRIKLYSAVRFHTRSTSQSAALPSAVVQEPRTQQRDQRVAQCVTPDSPSVVVNDPNIMKSATPAKPSSGPVTVRTPHDATRDCFSISAATVCRRSMLAFTAVVS